MFDKPVSSIHEFHQIVSSHPKTLVQFSAKWCGSCRHTKRFIDSLVVEYPEINFVYVDIDKTRPLSNLYNVTAIPAFMGMSFNTVLSTLEGSDPNQINSLIQGRVNFLAA